MKKEKNNFTRVVDWLLENGIIRTQKEMAEKMGTTSSTISHNKHGDVKRPDEDTLCKFKAAFGEIINIAYLRGESDVMLVEDLTASGVNSCKSPATVPGGSPLGSADSPTPSTAPGMDALTSALISAKDETIAAMKSELAAKDDIIASKDTLINILQQQVIDLREKLTLEKGLSTGASISEFVDRKDRPCQNQ